MLGTAAYSIPIAPLGPGTPFGTPALIFFDSLRMVVIVLGLANLGLKPWLFRRCVAPGQMARMAALGMLSVVAMTIELEHLGDYPNWRLFFALVAMIVNTWGNYSFLRYEAPSQIVTDRRLAAQQDAAKLRELNEERQRFKSGES